MAERRKLEGSPIDMTPMIDVVFQLIIFFIVTIQMEKEYNREIELANAPDGPAIEKEDPRTTIIEVDRRGWISLRGAKVSKARLRKIMKTKFRRRGGAFPVLIRGDWRARHQDIRAVMDICTSVGIWRINFAAIKEKKT